MSPVHDPRFSSTRWRKNLEADARWSTDQAKRDYLIAVGMILVGLAVFAVLALVEMGTALSIPAAAIAWGTLVIGASIVGIAALVVVCAAFGEDAGNFGLAFLRLMGIFSIALITLVVFGFGCIGMVVAAGVIGLAASVLFEWEGTVGMAFAVVMMLLFIALVFVLGMIGLS